MDSAEMVLLMALSEGGATPERLAQRVEMPRARVNFLLGRLVEAGLAQVESEYSDGERVQRVFQLRTPSPLPFRSEVAAAVSPDFACAASVTVPDGRRTEFLERMAALQRDFPALAPEPNAPAYMLVCIKCQGQRR